MDKDRLALSLKKASEAYYNGTTIMSDVEYDILRDRLKQIDPTNPVLAAVGAKPNSIWPKVKHDILMGSLAKETEQDGLSAWAENHLESEAGFCWSEKVDGISLRLTYDGGKLQQGATRGDGEIGDDITPNVLMMQNLPLTVENKNRFYVKAEGVVFIQDWQTHFYDDALAKGKELPSNPRNSAAGASRRLDGEKCEHIRVYAHGAEFTHPDDMAKYETEFEAMNFLLESGFTTPGFDGSPMVDALFPIFADYEENKRAKLPYEIDGIVVKVNDSARLKEFGDVDGRPRAARAWKFASLAADTTLLGVEWQTGRTGVVTPVGLLLPVPIGGVSISKASLINAVEINRLDIAIGNRVIVMRCNDVIPRVIGKAVIQDEEARLTKIEMPSVCPACSAPTHFDSVKLFCSNTDDCPAQLLLSITKYLKIIGVKGIGKKLIEKLMDAGVVESPADLYHLGVSDIAELEGQGVKNAKKVLDELRNKSQAVPLEKFVESLAMRGFGSKAKDLMVHYPTLEAMREAKYEDILKINGFGEHVAQCVVDGFKIRSSLIDRLTNVVQVIEPKAKESSKLEGMAFCFSGFRDPKAEEIIEANGGKVVSGVSKNTTHLVLADVTSGSSKAKKAKELGVKVLDERTLTQLLQNAIEES